MSNTHDTVLATQFADMAERLFGDLATPQVIEAAEDGIFPQALWDAIEESGICLAIVPEAQGGIGATLADAAAVLRVAGFHAVPGPLAETLLANHFLGAAGLPPVEGFAALAFVSGGADVGAGADALPSVAHVAWAGLAAEIVLVHVGDQSVPSSKRPARICRVAPASFEHVGVVDVDGEPHDMLAPTGGATAAWQTLPDMTGAQCMQHASVLRAAQMAGAMQWCLRRTTEYALERKQFGREIGRFQVVQQMIAELASATVACQAAVDAAVAEPSNALLVAAARSRLGDGVDTVCSVSHQVHGAIGFSYEYALHFRTRRLMSWRDQFGTVADWRRVLAGAFMGRSADEIWIRLSAATR